MNQEQNISSEISSVKVDGKRVLFLTTNLNTEFLAVGTKHISSWLAHHGAFVTIVAAPRLYRRPQQRAEICEWKTVHGKSILQCEPMSLIPYRLFRGTSLGRAIFGWHLAVSNPKLRAILEASWDLILLDDPIFSFALRSVSQPTILAYRPTDIYSMMKGGKIWDDIDREIIENSDWVIAMGAKTHEHMRQLGAQGERLLLMENGVDFTQFKAAEQGVSELSERFIGRKIALWVGVIDARFNIDLLQQVAEKRKDWLFVIVGPASTALDEEVRKNDNVIWLGPRKHSEIPGLMRDCTIGIMPLSRHPANECRSPMKLYEYLASGKTVVSCATEELRKRAEVGIFLADNADQFSQKMNEAEAWQDADSLIRAAERQDWSGKCNDVFRRVFE